jgi:protein SCO1/2
LTNGAGETVTDADVITAPTLVYFGYTFCPDVCPLDAARNGEAVALLEERGHDVNSVFISVDPERDTPEMVSDYASYMHERMVGLTGTPEQVKAASRAYKTYYKKQTPKDGDDEYYLMDHSTFTYLMFPETGFAEFYRRDMTAEKMAESVACFIENS